MNGQRMNVRRNIEPRVFEVRQMEAPPNADPDWWEAYGRCREVDADTFYPENGQSADGAKRICQGCPVRDACLDWALDVGERWGVWGGKSERQRKILAKQRGRAVEAA